jgi:hypothetical protein
VSLSLALFSPVSDVNVIGREGRGLQLTTVGLFVIPRRYTKPAIRRLAKFESYESMRSMFMDLFMDLEAGTFAFAIGTVVTVNENTCLESTGFGCWDQKRRNRRSPVGWRRRGRRHLRFLSPAFASASFARTNVDTSARAGYAWP